MTLGCLRRCSNKLGAGKWKGIFLTLEFFFFSKAILKCPAGNGAGKKLFSRNGECLKQSCTTDLKWWLRQGDHILHSYNMGLMVDVQENRTWSQLHLAQYEDIGPPSQQKGLPQPEQIVPLFGGTLEGWQDKIEPWVFLWVYSHNRREIFSQRYRY